jgi:hypothetical protein
VGECDVDYGVGDEGSENVGEDVVERGEERF